MVTIPRKYAQLNKADLSKIQALEKETGKIILVFEQETPYASLNEEQVTKIRQLEKELNVILLAYKP